MTRSAGIRSRMGKSFYQKLSDAEKANYKSYLDGARTHEVDRAISGEKRQKVEISVLPFGIQLAGAPALTDYHITSATTQAIEIAKLADTNLVDFGAIESADTHSSNSRFLPALVRPTLVAASDLGRAGVSAFTGRETKRFNSRGGSIPFGRRVSAIAEDYDKRRAAVLASIRDLNTGANRVKSVTFVAEYWQTDGSASTNALGTVTGKVDY